VKEAQHSLLAGESKDEVAVEFTPDPPTNMETGLTSSEVEERLAKYGPNALADSKDSLILQFLKCFWGPMPVMIWIAIIVEAINKDVPDFLVLLALQMLNGGISFIEAKNAGEAIDALKNTLAPQAEVKRNSKWFKLPARELVPGDLIQLKIGNIIPADCKICDGEDPLQVDQAALTGESLPVTIWPGSDCKMGSAVKVGEAEALVIATGSNTFLGRAASLVASVVQVGNFQIVMFRITMILLAMASVLCTIIFFFLIFEAKLGVLNTIAICVVLLVASIPIAMQVVCTSTLAVGSRRLAQKGAIVARLSSIEELAGMSMLCSDKTGTLTKNELVLNDPILFDELSADELVMVSALATKMTGAMGERDAIDTVIVNACDQNALKQYKQLAFVPFNPTDKRTEATIEKADGSQFRVAKGAPQVLLNMCANPEKYRAQCDESMVRLADRGYRPVAVSVTNDQGEWELKGMLSLFDPPRDDTAETIRIALTLGVEVKMITGDHVLIAKETARQLNMGTNIHSVHVLDDVEKNSSTRQLNDFVRKADGFAEVFPEHKFKIVDVLRDEGFVTGMTGDGVNDAPALKRADVGIAVEGSTEAAQAAADIVLTEPGLYTIIDAIIRSRKIFQRMRNYVMYRIACSFQLLIFLFISVLTIKPQAYFGTVSVNSHAFVLPVTALVIITILNDGTIITISHDKVIPDNSPSKWLLPEAVGIASALGFCTTVASYLLLRAGTICANPNISQTLATIASDTGAARSVVCTWIGTKQTPSGDWYIEFGELLAAVYLEVSITDFLTVFAARTRSFAFTRRPGYALLCALVVANSASTILAAFWPFPNSGAGTDNLSPIPGKLIGVVWIYSIIEFIVQDMFKVLVYMIRDKLMFQEKIDRAEVEKRKVITTTLDSEKRKARETMDRAQLHREISVMRENSILAPAPQGANDVDNLPPIRTETLSKRNLV